MKFSLIMPMYKTEKYLEKAIKSIVAQDYKDWELIIVADGKSKEGEKISNKFKDKRIKYITIPHQGVCVARNEGLKLAQGKYISFFSSDFKMNAGCLRTWLYAFQDNKDIDFVYGGYGLTDEGKEVFTFQSEPYDEKQLEVYNYIDGGFPIKKEKCPQYDPAIKSLNDWDFWLQAVKDNKAKGIYIKEITYTAEVPKVGGLSNDSSEHWLERVKQIKKKHNITMKDICVSSIGAPFHGKRVANLLKADFNVMPCYKPNEYKMIYLLGFYITRADIHARVFMNADNTLFKGKKVVHWIGSDIAQLQLLTFEKLKFIRKSLNDKFINICECNYTKRELIELGIKISNVIPLPLENHYEFKPLPEKFTIGIYAPAGDKTTEEKYNIDLMRSIIVAMPDVEFKLFGTVGKGKQRNEEHCGWVDMREFIPTCSMLIRYTVHDGFPISPLEFMLGGREVLTSVSQKHAHYIDIPQTMENYTKTKETLIKKIRDIQNNPISDEKRKYVSDYWKKELDVEKFNTKIRSLI